MVHIVFLASILSIQIADAMNLFWSVLGLTTQDTQQDWFCAIKSGDLDQVKKLISQVDINKVDTEGHTPLHMAAALGHAPIVSLLLNIPNININARDYNRCTALHLAVEHNHESVISLFLADIRIQVNCGDYATNQTPLMQAVQAQNLSIVELLLTCPRLDVNAPNKYGLTPLMAASFRNKSDDIALALLGHPDINVYAQNINKTDARQYALNAGRKNIVASIFEKMKCDLFDAIKLKNISKLKQVLSALNKEVINITDRDSDTALHKAVRSGSLEIVFLILKISPELIEMSNIKDESPIDLSVVHANIFNLFMDLAFADKLFVRGAQIDKKDEQKKRCAICAKESADLCSICKKVYYCSRACQVKDWKTHKLVCRKV